MQTPPHSPNTEICSFVVLYFSPSLLAAYLLVSLCIDQSDIFSCKNLARLKTTWSDCVPDPEPVFNGPGESDSSEVCVCVCACVCCVYVCVLCVSVCVLCVSTLANNCVLIVYSHI